MGVFSEIVSLDLSFTRTMFSWAKKKEKDVSHRNSVRESM